MLMMVTLVGVMLGALLVPIVVTQSRSTRFDTSRVHALDAAQAGIDAALGQIRSAVGADNTGDSSLLPCATTHSGKPITGKANSSGLATYAVYIDYYTGGTAAAPTGLMPICAQGHGPYDGGTTVTPAFARLTSMGTDGPARNGSSGGRTLVTTYVFETNNANISGGTIRIYTADHDTTNWCLDVGVAYPAEGTPVRLQQCSTSVPVAPQQKFAYRSDLTIQLASSVGSVVGGVTYANGLCIDAQTLNTGGTAPLAGSALVLKKCATVGSPVWSQQLSIDRHRSIQAPLKTSATSDSLSNLCMTVDLVSSGGNLIHGVDNSVTLQTCDGSLTSPTDAWVPSPAIGAGAAVKTNSSQWINFYQFGRCLNATNNDPDAPYLTAPGCRQNPYPNAAEYVNQKITYNATTDKHLYWTLNGTDYCLYNQAKPTSTNLLDHRVLMVSCASHSGISNIQLQWKRTTPTTDPSLPYTAQFRFQTMDSSQQCLSLADIPAVPGDPYGHQYDVWQKAVTVTCDFSPIQQWNASVNPSGSSLQNTTEK